MRHGVVEFVDKSSVLGQAALMKQKMLQAMSMDKPKPALEKSDKTFSIPVSFSTFVPEVIAIGASTGGTQALQELLISLPHKCPPLIVVQHISPKFARSFAEKLSQVSGLEMKEFKTTQTELLPGKIYLALDDYHIIVKKINGKNHICKAVHINEDSFHRPSVDVLFKSLAAQGVKTLGCLLTGMGKDGAQGMLQLKSGGSLTLAQNAESCIVYGMPGEAAKIGAVTYTGDLQALRNVIDTVISR
jgi:two-component system chemotaxis response regulator CheB